MSALVRVSPPDMSSAAQFAGVWVSGNYYMPISQDAVGTSSTLGNGTLRLVGPFYLPSLTSFSRIGCDLAGGAGEAGSTFRMGIFSDVNGVPTARQLDSVADAVSGSINGASATVQEVTINLTLVGGWYWLGGAVQVAPTTQPTVRTCGTRSARPIPQGSQPTAAQALLGYAQSSVTGALPSTFAGAAAGVNGPRVFLKVA